MADGFPAGVAMSVATALVSKDNPAVQGMQLRLSQYQVRSNVPMFGLHGLISRPLPGAQVVVLHGSGDPSNAVGIGVNDPRHYRPGLPDGAVGLGHHQGGTVLLTEGKIELHGDGETLRRLVTEVFLDLFNRHTHPTPQGDSGPPHQQMQANSLTVSVQAGGP